jgi:hypothetical protein
MIARHKELAAGRWYSFSLAKQLGNIDSEVGRALSWQQRGNAEHCIRAVERALELLDVTLADARHRGRLRELAGLREALVDYFYADNRFSSTPDRWRSYFTAFAAAVRANR